MNLKATVFSLAMLAVCNWAGAQATVIIPNSMGLIIPKLYMDSCSSYVSMGKASLTVNPLTHTGKFYVGDYQLNVLPYYFKNEKGTLELSASEASVRKLQDGIPVKFTGIASDNKKGRPKVITGTATPINRDKGSVTFSIQTDNGLMVFNTTYHFEK
jgi:hypothetical protein